MTTLLRTLAFFVSIYSILCLLRIILTWIPQNTSSPLEKFLSKICDPFLNFFSRFKWARIGTFDFSAALGLCVLSAVSSLLSSMAHMGRMTLSSLLALLINIIWTFISSILIFFIILLLVRLTILLVNKSNYKAAPIITSIDYSLDPLLRKITKAFVKKDSYKARLIASLIIIFVFYILLLIIFNFVISCLTSLPF